MKFREELTGDETDIISRRQEFIKRFKSRVGTNFELNLEDKTDPTEPRREVEATKDLDELSYQVRSLLKSYRAQGYYARHGYNTRPNTSTQELVVIYNKAGEEVAFFSFHLLLATENSMNGVLNTYDPIVNCQFGLPGVNGYLPDLLDFLQSAFAKSKTLRFEKDGEERYNAIFIGDNTTIEFNSKAIKTAKKYSNK
jgi:hypothetical protein